jgi:hypothetical protein
MVTWVYPYDTFILIDKRSHINIFQIECSVDSYTGFFRKDRIHLIDLIFGEQGILNSSDTFQFEERCSQLLTNANTPDFYNYYERTMKPTLELNYKNYQVDQVDSVFNFDADLVFQVVSNIIF